MNTCGSCIGVTFVESGSIVSVTIETNAPIRKQAWK